MDTDFFKWSDTYCTNISAIDIQHKVLIKVLNELYQAVMVNNEEEKMADIISELVQYTKYHFKEEEKLFTKYNYTEEESHKKTHQKFIGEITAFSKKQKNGDNFLAFDVINFLKDWLIEHILISDQKYVKFFKQNNIIV